MKINKILTFFVLILLQNTTFSQSPLPESCKLKFGTNLGGLSDYGTELPFVDMMHGARTWYTKDVGNPNGSPFDTQVASYLAYRPDGYPTKAPQTVAGQAFPQTTATIWAGLDGWKVGTYTVFFDGAGQLEFNGASQNVTQVNPNQITFDLLGNLVGNYLEMTVLSSALANPVRNIRIIMPGHVATYTTQPFNPLWLSRVQTFKSVRFMDWAQTNNWGQSDQYDWDSPTLFDWADRQKMDNYTWTNEKGIPYEMMIKLMNDYNLDGWVCVPHRASNNYIQNMALLFKNTLSPSRKLYVEYSNEIWNWMFGQAQWANKYGGIATGLPWPECTVTYIQNCMNQWTTVFAGQLSRIVRVVAVQAAWQDVSNRVVFNMVPGSFDAFSPAFYFGLGSDGDAALDILGANATVADVAYWVRKTRETDEKVWLTSQKTQIADALNIPMIFYEGGQHVTPTPFGEAPTYAQALLDIQRDTAMYNLYNEWFTFVRTLQTGSQPLLAMSFSLISQRSAQYGSWGILETMDQNTTLVPAPKYKSIIEAMTLFNACSAPLSVNWQAVDARCDEKAVKLHWATASESENNYYVVEKGSKNSTGSVEWQSIGTVSGSGNSATTHHYSFVDNQPHLSEVYYRIGQVGKDGKMTYSDVFADNSCWENNGKRQFAISPNPFEEQIQITSNQPFARIQIFNALGIEVLSEKINGETATLQTRNLQAGIYFLQITDDDNNRILYRSKLVK